VAGEGESLREFRVRRKKGYMGGVTTSEEAIGPVGKKRVEEAYSILENLVKKHKLKESPIKNLARGGETCRTLFILQEIKTAEKTRRNCHYPKTNG